MIRSCNFTDCQWRMFFLPFSKSIFLLDYFQPLVYLSEEPLEAHNKVKKFNRLHHTAKISRKDTMEQWINRSLDCSDPLVLEFSQAARIKKRNNHKIEDYPKVIQDMIIMDHPINVLIFQ